MLLLSSIVIVGQAGAIGRSGRISETKVPVQAAGAAICRGWLGAKVLAWRG